MDKEALDELVDKVVSDRDKAAALLQPPLELGPMVGVWFEQPLYQVTSSENDGYSLVVVYEPDSNTLHEVMEDQDPLAGTSTPSKEDAE